MKETPVDSAHHYCALLCSWNTAWWRFRTDDLAHRNVFTSNHTPQDDLLLHTHRLGACVADTSYHAVTS